MPSPTPPAPTSSSAPATPNCPSPNAKLLPKLEVRPPSEKLKHVPYVSVDAFFSHPLQAPLPERRQQGACPSHRPSPQQQTSRLERAKQALANVETINSLMLDNIRSAYHRETCRLAAEGARGERIIQANAQFQRQSSSLPTPPESDKPPPVPSSDVGHWSLPDDQADKIIANLQPPRPGMDVPDPALRWQDFNIQRDRARPKDYSSRVNDALLDNICEGASNARGFVVHHAPALKKPFEMALIMERERERERVDRAVAERTDA